MTDHLTKDYTIFLIIHYYKICTENSFSLLCRLRVALNEMYFFVKITRQRGKGDAGCCTKKASKIACPKKRRAHNKGGGLKKLVAQIKSSSQQWRQKKSKGSKHLE